jgi:hypothetical protein
LYRVVVKRPMSPLGQSRRFRDAPTISGVPQSTDIAGGRRQVGFVPNADIRHVRA